MLNVMNHGFSFKNSRYPIDHLIEISLLNKRESLNKYVEKKIISLDEDYIVFSKMNSNATVAKVNFIFVL